MKSITIFGTAPAAALIELALYDPNILKNTRPETILPFAIEGMFEIPTKEEQKELENILEFDDSIPETYRVNLQDLHTGTGSQIGDLLSRCGNPEEIELLNYIRKHATTFQAVAQL